MADLDRVKDLGQKYAFGLTLAGTILANVTDSKDYIRLITDPETRRAFEEYEAKKGELAEFYEKQPEYRGFIQRKIEVQQWSMNQDHAGAWYVPVEDLGLEEMARSFGFIGQTRAARVDYMESRAGKLWSYGPTGNPGIEFVDPQGKHSVFISDDGERIVIMKDDQWEEIRFTHTESGITFDKEVRKLIASQPHPKLGDVVRKERGDLDSQGNCKITWSEEFSPDGSFDQHWDPDQGTWYWRNAQINGKSVVFLNPQCNYEKVVKESTQFSPGDVDGKKLLQVMKLQPELFKDAESIYVSDGKVYIQRKVAPNDPISYQFHEIEIRGNRVTVHSYNGEHGGRAAGIWDYDLQKRTGVFRLLNKDINGRHYYKSARAYVKSGHLTHGDLRVSKEDAREIQTQPDWWWSFKDSISKNPVYKHIVKPVGDVFGFIGDTLVRNPGGFISRMTGIIGQQFDPQSFKAALMTAQGTIEHERTIPFSIRSDQEILRIALGQIKDNDVRKQVYSFLEEDALHLIHKNEYPELSWEEFQKKFRQDYPERDAEGNNARYKKLATTIVRNGGADFGIRDLKRHGTAGTATAYTLDFTIALGEMAAGAYAMKALSPLGRWLGGTTRGQRIAAFLGREIKVPGFKTAVDVSKLTPQQRAAVAMERLITMPIHAPMQAGFITTTFIQTGDMINKPSWDHAYELGKNLASWEVFRRGSKWESTRQEKKQDTRKPNAPADKQADGKNTIGQRQERKESTDTPSKETEQIHRDRATRIRTPEQTVETQIKLIEEFKYGSDNRAFAITFPETLRAQVMLRDAAKLLRSGKRAEAEKLLNEARKQYETVINDKKALPDKVQQAKEGLALIDTFYRIETIDNLMRNGIPQKLAEDLAGLKKKHPDITDDILVRLGRSGVDIAAFDRLILELSKQYSRQEAVELTNLYVEVHSPESVVLLDSLMSRGIALRTADQIVRLADSLGIVKDIVALARNGERFENPEGLKAFIEKEIQGELENRAVEKLYQELDKESMGKLLNRKLDQKLSPNEFKAAFNERFPKRLDKESYIPLKDRASAKRKDVARSDRSEILKPYMSGISGKLQELRLAAKYAELGYTVRLGGKGDVVVSKNGKTEVIQLKALTKSDEKHVREELVYAADQLAGKAKDSTGKSRELPEPGDIRIIRIELIEDPLKINDVTKGNPALYRSGPEVIRKFLREALKGKENAVDKVQFNDGNKTYEFVIAKRKIQKMENGHPVVDKDGKPVYEMELDERGQPYLDKNGHPIYKMEPILDKDGFPIIEGPYELPSKSVDDAVDELLGKYSVEDLKAMSRQQLGDKIYDEIYKPVGAPKPATISPAEYSARISKYDGPWHGADGYWHRRYGTAGDATKDVQRFYFNVMPDKAADLADYVAAQLNKQGIPFQYKMPLRLDQFNRADAAVLYVDKANYQAVKEIVEEYARKNPAFFAEGSPAFTQPIAKGIAVAEEPAAANLPPRDGGHSFGSSRADIIAEAIKAAPPGATIDQIKQLVRERFKHYGLDPTQPWLNPGSVNKG